MTIPIILLTLTAVGLLISILQIGAAIRENNAKEVGIRISTLLWQVISAILILTYMPISV